MKITFVTSHLTVYGGGGIVVQDYANKLSEWDHQVSIVAQKVNDKYYQFDSDVKIIEIGGPLPLNPFHWIKLFHIRNKYLKTLKKINPNVAISQNFPSNYFCTLKNEKKIFKHIFYCHEPYRYFHDKVFYSNLPPLMRLTCWFLRLLFKKYDVKSVKNVDKIVCNSKFTKRRVKKIYGEESIVHYPVLDMDKGFKKDWNIYKELNIGKNSPIIFTLGLTHYLKGSSEIMYIFKKVLEQIPNAVLVIGGWMIEENKRIINKLLSKLNIPNKNIIIYGYIQDELLNNFYKNATVTFYTALREPFGLIPVESMKNGTPVIAFKSGGPSETVLNNKTGFLIEPGNLKEFSSKTIKLIKNKDLRERFSKNCINYVKNNFNFEKAVQNLESILSRIRNS